MGEGKEDHAGSRLDDSADFAADEGEFGVTLPSEFGKNGFDELSGVLS